MRLMTYVLRRLSFVVALVALVAFAATGRGRASAESVMENGQPAPEGSWERLGPCVEPDVYNRSTEPLTFVVQATIGADKASEVMVTHVVLPGERAHLHLFAEVWENPSGPSMLIELEEALGCQFVVRIAAG